MLEQSGYGTAWDYAYTDSYDDAPLLAGALLHVVVLIFRLSAEERVLFANPDYAAAMRAKPRFLPGLF